MKLDERTKRRRQPQTFSGRVEVAITGIDIKNRRMVSGYRKSFRVLETTVEEIYELVYESIRSCTEGEEST